MEKKKLFLFDAYALIYRSYFAFIRAPRINSKGLNTSAIFGFVNTLDQVLNAEGPSHLAVVFDPSGPTFRHEMFPEYKAHREATPEDIKKSLPYIRKIVKAFNIEQIEVKGFEADDVIGTLACAAEKQGYEVFMMTPDKDYAQLVSENIRMYKPGKSGGDAEIWGVDEVNEKFGIKNPGQVVDILALWGDSADNIPGAPGIGEKTSKILIEKYDSVENLLENTADLKGKQKESIEAFRDQIILSKKLVTIERNVPVDVDISKLKKRVVNEDEVREVFEELEFRTMLQRFLKDKEQSRPSQSQQTSMNFFDESFETVERQETFDSISSTDHNYFLVTEESGMKDLCKKLLSSDEVCFDTETTGLDNIDNELTGISFSVKDHEAYFIPVPENRIEAMKILEIFRPVFESESILKIGQNIKFDIMVLLGYGINVNGRLFDTMIAHYLLQPEQRHGMDFLAEVYLKYRTISFEDLLGAKGRNQRTMREMVTNEPLKVTDYACEDADITFRLKKLFKEELIKNNLLKLAEEIEFPLISVLADMERTGVRINTDSLESFSLDLTDLIIKTEKEIIDLVGFDFNVSSPKQLGEVLFVRLKLDDKAKKTKTGQYSTNEETLERLTDKHPVINKILDYRGYKKLLSTYVDSLPKLVNSTSGKIHTSYNQAVASTGRLSSVNPNLQNIPIREGMGRKIRKVFIPSSEDYMFFSADYSQIELRLMAHLSEDKNLIEAFSNKEDIHSATASKIFKVDISEVNREMRAKAKTANFGIIYGISSFGLSQRLNISRSEGKELIDGYFENYPGVKEYMDKCIHIAREKGYVETIFGRKRVLSDINSKNAVVRGMAERNAINAPIQGSAADIIKIAMININSEFKKRGLKSKMIIQVHDELNFDVLKSELEEVKEIVIDKMQNAVRLNVPLTVDYGTGANWLEAH